jgi:Spy/CpxP family protein refolding chaperone
MKKMFLILALIATVALVATAAMAAPEGRGPGQGLGANLTDEQRTQLFTKVDEMKAAGAKPEEIKTAVAELFKGWGVEMPQRLGRGQGQGGPGGPGKGFGANLTEEQRTQLHAKVKEMRAADAKPEEIKTAVAELFKGWGVEMPQRGQGQGGPGGPGKGLMANLTEEQRTQLQAKIKELRAADAKPEEIHAAVAEMCKGWGVEMPQRGQGQGGPGGARNGFGANLTEEQRTQVQAKVKEMRQAGAQPEEIRAAVQELLKGWGVQPPQRGQGHGPMQDLLQDLTPEQRQQVMAKVRELRQNGAPREEIKKSIEEMLKDFEPKA